jgi:hypothetical protein
MACWVVDLQSVSAVFPSCKQLLCPCTFKSPNKPNELRAYIWLSAAIYLVNSLVKQSDFGLIASAFKFARAAMVIINWFDVKPNCFKSSFFYEPMSFPSFLGTSWGLLRGFPEGFLIYTVTKSLGSHERNSVLEK